MKKHKKFTQIYKDSILSTGEFYVKLVLTIFLVALYVILFIEMNGISYFEISKYCSAFAKEPFSVHFIDVENGDAILLKLPDGKTMMIDTGEGKYSERVSSYIRQFQRSEKSNKIDFLVLTHSDSDHIGNAKEIIKSFKVQTLIRPKVYSKYEVEKGLNERDYKVEEGIVYNEVIKEAYNQKCEIVFAESGQSFQFRDCLLEILSPSLDSYGNSNNYSTVIMLTYNNKKFLFMGDAESYIEKRLIEEYGAALKADVLKVGHHGSYTSTSVEFLSTVRPEYAIILSSGTSTILPNYDVLERIKNSGAEILATGNIGSFALSVQNNIIVYAKAEKSPNDLVLILAIFVIIVFIIWKNPFKTNYDSFEIND